MVKDMESVLSLIILLIVIVISAVRKNQRLEQGRNNRNTIQKQQGGFSLLQKKNDSSRPSAKPNVPNRKLTGASKGIPSHLENRSQAITGQAGGRQERTGRTNDRQERENGSRSRRAIALRLMEGDPVPEGYDAYVCHYCAAVNLIKHNARGKYCCYFCHDPIEQNGQ